MKRLGIGLGIASLSMVLASCTGSRTIETEYVDLAGETKEVTIEKTIDKEKVLDTLKVISKADASKVSATSMKNHVKLDMKGSMYSKGFKCYMDIALLTDWAFDNRLDMDYTMNMEFDGRSEKMNNRMILVGNYAYLNTNALGRITKMRMSTSSTEVQDLVNTLNEQAKEFDNIFNRSLKEFFDLSKVDYQKYDSSYDAIVQNEAKILDFIEKANVEISSVTDNIYFKMTLTGDELLSAFNNTGSTLGEVSYVGLDDSLIYTIGYNTDTYLLSYVEMDCSNAKSLTSIVSEASMSVNTFMIYCTYEYGDERVEEPSDKDSYVSYDSYLY